MTDDPANNPASELRPELRAWCDAWKACLENVLSQVSGKSNVFEVSDPTPAEPYQIPLMVPQFLTEAALRERLTELGHRPEFASARATSS